MTTTYLPLDRLVVCNGEFPGRPAYIISAANGRPYLLAKSAQMSLDPRDAGQTIFAGEAVDFSALAVPNVRLEVDPTSARIGDPELLDVSIRNGNFVVQGVDSSRPNLSQAIPIPMGAASGKGNAITFIRFTRWRLVADLDELGVGEPVELFVREGSTND